MARKASIHFKPVQSIRFSVSHSERTDLSEPSYLLPKKHQLGNIIIQDSLSENALAAEFIRQKEGMSGQAKSRGSSPFWEGVVVLPNTNGKEQSDNLQTWKKAYEEATGHKVLHMSIHLDEGYIDKDGNPQYNPHAHVIVNRMNEHNRVIDLDRKQMAKVQDLTAATLKMERGSTLEERQGKRGRKHIPHAEFRQMEDTKRQELVNEVTTLKEAHAREIGSLKSTIEKLKADYAKERQALKDSGAAIQADYQKLKRENEAMKRQSEFALIKLLKSTATPPTKIPVSVELQKTVEGRQYQKPLEKAGEALEIAQLIARTSINADAAKRGIAAVPYPTNDKTTSAKHPNGYEIARLKAKKERDEAKKELLAHTRQPRPKGFFKMKEAAAYDEKTRILTTKVEQWEVALQDWEHEIKWRDTTHEKAISIELASVSVAPLVPPTS